MHLPSGLATLVASLAYSVSFVNAGFSSSSASNIAVYWGMESLVSTGCRACFADGDMQARTRMGKQRGHLSLNNDYHTTVKVSQSPQVQSFRLTDIVDANVNVNDPDSLVKDVI